MKSSISASDLNLNATPEEQARFLQEGLARVKVHSFHMRKSLDSDRVMDAVKHALEMATELRVSALTPKTYYELYMLAFDNLKYLATMLEDAHLAHTINLAELYELVQYTANIVPRLYLMITIASAYLPMNEAPAKIILRDLIDMCRGVQHPVRGLFLRHYLSSMTKDYLPDGPANQASEPKNVPLPSSTAPSPVGQLRSPDESSSQGLADGEVVPLVDADQVIVPPVDENQVSAPLMDTDQAAAPEPTGADQNQDPETSHSIKPAQSILGISNGNVNDSISFVMQNFVEMNKLWVRLQYQGPTRDRDRREAERRELRILVGTNIVRLAQLEAVNLEMYKTKILPPILDQIVHCRDVIAQEYLMEVIIQVFPDTFHLHTLAQVLETVKLLQTQVSIKQIIVALIDRLRTFSSEWSHLQKKPSQSSDEGLGPSERSPSPDTAMRDSSGAFEDELDGISPKIQLFDVFWSQITQVITARPDLDIQDISSLLLSLIQLSVTCYPDKILYTHEILKFAREQLLKVSGSSELAAATNTANFYKILLAPLQGVVPTGMQLGSTATPAAPNILKLFQLPNHAQSFRELLAMQPYSTRHAIAVYLIHQMVHQTTRIEDEEHLIGLFDCIQVLVKDQRDAPLWKNTGMYVEQRRVYGAASSEESDISKRQDEHLEEIATEQALVAKFAALIVNESTTLHAHLLTVARKYLSEGGGIRMKHTFPTLTYQAVQLVHRVAASHAEEEESEPDGKASPNSAENPSEMFTIGNLVHNTSTSSSSGTNATNTPKAVRDRELMYLFKFTHQLVTAIQLKSDDVILASQLFLVCAKAADDVGLEEIAYEFFVSALTVYEESINDSRLQFMILTSIINALIECQVFSVDNYDTLATKCTLHASRLLKRPDQCRAVIQCAHLFWTHHDNYRDGKRVLECLQKALKFADSCLDSIMNVELFIEVLVRYIYFYEKGCTMVTPKYINGLLELIATNLMNLRDATASVDAPPQTADGNRLAQIGFSTTSLVGPEVADGTAAGKTPAGASDAANTLDAVAGHFRRTCAMLLQRQANPPKTLGDGPLYTEIVVPALSS